MESIFVFGTGHALVTRLYNACFAVRHNGDFFLLDGGGGSRLLAAWEETGVSPARVRHLFISHRHIDHLLGCVWAVRKIAEEMLLGSYEGVFTVFAHKALLDTFQSICHQTLQPKLTALLDERVRFLNVEDRQTVALEEGYEASFFDTGSSTVDQFGCSLRDGSGRRVTYLGDEPFHSRSAPYAESCDWLICEALCLESEETVFRAHATHHSTVKDACVIAERLRVKNLLLAHTEDTHGAERKRLYMREGSAYFSGSLYVPDDCEILPLA